MRPRFPETVTIRTPGTVTVDPLTGLPQTTPETLARTRARISQTPVGDISAQVELLAQQQTVISLWTIIVPAGTVLNASSIVIDQAGRMFSIEGDVADRPNHRPVFRAAAARLISDMQ